MKYNTSNYRRVECPARHTFYLYLYLQGRQPKLTSTEAVYVQPNMQPQYDQRSGKPLSGSHEPTKSDWSHFA